MMQQLAGKNEAQITMKISFFGTVSVDGSEILHQLIDSLSHGFTGFCTSQVGCLINRIFASLNAHEMAWNFPDIFSRGSESSN